MPTPPLVFGVGAIGSSQGRLVSAAAAAVCALAAAPLRNRLQRGVNRFLYGARDEPASAVAELGHRLEATLGPDAVLPTLVDAVSRALRLPYAAVELATPTGFAPGAHVGTPRGTPLEIPLVAQGETVGRLMLSPRRAGEELSPADRRVLELLARQAGPAVQAVRLHADLQRSREQLITAREEERRRLRRDLHDGLGPSLAAIAMQLSVADSLEGEELRKLHETLEAQASQALADIRRLVYELRPPALDELGLVSALREQGRRFGSLSVTIDADERFDDLPAALEVAIYRIASEAITNAARHGDAKSCEVRLSVDDALDLDVRDDGKGLPLNAARGRRPDVDARARNRARRHLYDRQRGRRRHARACPAARPRGGPVDPVRTLIADDHPVFRGGLRTLLAADEMVEIVGEATNGTEAVALAEELQPDVVVMDLQMPELNGIEATRQIVARSPHVGVLVLTMFEDDDSVFAAMRAGARGYLLKGAGPGEITRAIRAVGSGEAIFGPDVARRVMDYFTTPRPELAAMAFPELTDREREVLELIAQGRNNQWIARHFVLSPKTIRNHVSNIFTKLQVADRAEAIVRAREAGLGQAGTR